VHCYTTDWVKDDNKYGHYESIGAVSFNNQIYEGPDTDIETGNGGFSLAQMLLLLHLLKMDGRLNFLFSLTNTSSFSYLLCNGKKIKFHRKKISSFCEIFIGAN
jgi:hypothetical protein